MAQAESPLRSEHHQGQVAIWRTSDWLTNFMVHTTLPTEDREHRGKILEIMDSDTRNNDTLIGQVFYVGEFVIHPVPVVNEDTGEETLGRRIVFPQPDGLPVAFVSEPLIKSLQQLAWAVGTPPPWDPPIKVRLRQVGTRNKRRCFKVALDRG